MSQTTQLFISGRSQAVRLPASFRFDGNENFIRMDAATGDVILSSKPSDWESFFAARALGDVPDGFCRQKNVTRASIGAIRLTVGWSLWRISDAGVGTYI